MATSKIFHLKWTVSDCEDDYRSSIRDSLGCFFFEAEVFWDILGHYGMFVHVPLYPSQS